MADVVEPVAIDGLCRWSLWAVVVVLCWVGGSVLWWSFWIEVGDDGEANCCK